MPQPNELHCPPLFGTFELVYPFQKLFSMCVCFITAGPITKLFAWGGDGTLEESGTLTQGAPVFPGSSSLGIEPKTPGWLVQDPTIRLTGCVCFITPGPITKLFAWGEEESGGHVPTVMRDDEPRPVWIGTLEEPGTLTQGAPVFPGSSRLGIEPKTPGWLVQDPTTRPIFFFFFFCDKWILLVCGRWPIS